MKLQNPLVSVITVTFNASASIYSTMRSIVSQASSAYEWIVVDGASTDNTVTLIESGSEGIPLTIHSEKDNGLYDAMNKGLELASGTYAIFMNSGDSFADGNVLRDFEQAVAEMHHLPAMVYGHTTVEFHDGTMFERRTRSLPYIKHGQPTIHQSVLFRRDVHLNMKYPYGAYPISADYAVMATLQSAAQNEVYLWNRTVSIFRNDPRSASNRHTVRRIKEAWRVQRDILGVPLPLRILSATRRFAAVPFYNFRTRPS